MRKTNGIRMTFRYKTLWFLTSCVLPAMLLFSTGSSAAGKGVQVSAPRASIKADGAGPIVATGVPYDVNLYITTSNTDLTWGPGKIALPTGFHVHQKIEYAKVIEAKIDNPGIVQIVGWKKGTVTLIGKNPGVTMLHVKARGEWNKVQKLDVPVGTLAPDKVRLKASCDDGLLLERASVKVPVGREMSLQEELYFGDTKLVTDRFPPIEVGALARIPDPVVTKDGKRQPDPMETSKTVRVKAPATGTKTVLKIQEHGIELPVHVYEISEIGGLRIKASEKMRDNGATDVKFEFVVNGDSACIGLPLEVTIGPSSVCRLHSDLRNLSAKKWDAGYGVYELNYNPRGLKLAPGGTPGICTVTATAPGTGKTASANIVVEKGNN